MLYETQPVSQQGITNYPLSDAEKPLAIDLYCGLGGWAEGFLSEGYNVLGFDIERHDYGTGTYPGQLVIQDVRTLHGSQFKDAAVIVASPPCQAYSYRAMPWKRAKALPPPDNTLFNECFRIQHEACEAAGRYIPLIVENVRGAQRWVGRSRWHHGSYHLWGDVPALMPITAGAIKVPSFRFDGSGKSFHMAAVKGMGCGSVSWHQGKGHRSATDPRNYYSTSPKRKAASAQIAKVPFPLAQHIARVFKPFATSILLIASLLGPCTARQIPPHGKAAPMFVLSEVARKRYAQFQLGFEPSVSCEGCEADVKLGSLLEPKALPASALERLARKFRPLIDRVMARLSEAEQREINTHLKADYRQSWICLSFANRGISDPFVSSSYQMYGIHPSKVWESIVADRKARLGADYYDWYNSDDLLRVDVPVFKRPPVNDNSHTACPISSEPSQEKKNA